MKFLELSFDDTSRLVADHIISALQEHETVLWLTSGGSNIVLQVSIMKTLHARAKNLLHKLVILPGDERYGLSGHDASNYRAMKEAGFNPGDASWPDILSGDKSFCDTSDAFERLVDQSIQKAGVSIATLGLGTDGHIAGILPGSPAVAATTLVARYESSYDRITLTFEALRALTTVFVVALSDDKRAVMARLKEKRDEPKDFPSVILYQLNDCTVITSKTGGEA